jgi:hypothetical protein
MSNRGLLAAVTAAAVCVGIVCAQTKQGQKKSGGGGELGYSDTPQLPNQRWKVHDVERPRPRYVAPGARAGDPPADAVVLFDGKDLSKWQNRRKSRDGGGFTEARWKVADGYFEVVGSTGDLVSKDKFGDCQIHLEWAAPATVKGRSQLRGNSGVLIMERYEVQVLDSWDNPTYADGGAGSIYGQWPPLFNTARKPGEWQVYDIVFEAPLFENGKVVKQANATVFLNGVVLHHRQEFIGPMAHRIVKQYEAHAAKESLALQDHGDPVRYRNIWVRALGAYDQP